MSFTVGIRKETKPQERRVVVRPGELYELTRGHFHLPPAKHSAIYLIEENAGKESGFDNSLYTTMGGVVVPFRKDGRSELFTRSNMVVGVKEPLPAEWPYMMENQIHFAFFHYPSGPELYQANKRSKITAIAFEGIEEADKSRPILGAMSEVAAEYSIRIADKYYCRAEGRPWNQSIVLVFGAKGVLGRCAMEKAIARGAFVVGFDMYADEAETREIMDSIGCTGGCQRVCPGILQMLYKRILRPTPELMRLLVPLADIFVMAAAARNKPAPKILTEEWLSVIKAGAIITDPSIDEGGCTARSRTTSHVEPVITLSCARGPVLYCGVPNMPGGIPEMATEMISREVSRYIPRILAHVNADNTFNKSLLKDEALVKGFALYRGIPVDPYIAGLFGDPCVSLETLLK